MGRSLPPDGIAVAAREERFKQAAWAYLAYGIFYWVGGLYLATRGLAVGRGIIWFVLGAIFVVVFPWLIARGHRAKGYLWFCRILTLLVAYRAFEVGRVALAPRFPAVPLPGGGEVPMSLGAAVFFLITLATAAMLARAAWARR
ncbi:MAG: hypothetical protein HY726_19740 [Candidatus Rokubacteria bacterium]|nr:hypothetical protein [Candidatus Rokubacteria bacterium]